MSTDFSSTFDEVLREVVRLEPDVPASCALPRPGDIVEGKYRIEEKLGQGGMGAVFRATHMESGKPVALKWLLARSSRGTARLVREAQAAARIEHPNVVNVFDVGTHEGGRFLVMELLRGQSLRERFAAGPLGADELVPLMISVLRGLHAAHASGVIHRDLKPDNVFLCVGPDGTPREPKIVDFGISKLRRRIQGDPPLTEQGSCLGTPLYMSPEQRADAPSVDERADIYAAGVLMYEALSGELPPDPARDAPSAPSGGVPPGLAAIIARALSPRVEARHESAQALLRDLEHWLRGTSEQVETREVRSRPHPSRVVLRRVARVALALAALALCGSWVVWRVEPEPPSPRAEPELSPRQGPALAVSDAVPSAPSEFAPHAELPRDAPAPDLLPSQETPEAAPVPSVAPPVAAPLARPVASRAGPIRLTDL